ncbi:hypothetical protein LTR37_001476 [Vermiconidia calcicola]|uniref:Uncharacterized protein n=1 Tax=Vermiconidia calcicola TaxID=1690605 RepID=A0ACC3NW56_9PEZI|nr:hypothetical protein LTR37_001476 [Vermiconidia calcicola]
MAPPHWANIQKNVKLICDIKLRNVPRNPNDKSDDICNLYQSKLISEAEARVIVQLTTCHACYFHKHCIVQHVLKHKTTTDFATQAIVERGIFRDATAPNPDPATEQLTKVWIDRDGNIRWFDHPNMKWDCPTCGSISNILPSENEYDYAAAWTDAEMVCAKEFFTDNALEEATIRRDRTKLSDSFARDLRAAKRYAQARVAEANGVVGVVGSASFSTEVIGKENGWQGGVMLYLTEYEHGGSDDATWEIGDHVSSGAMDKWLDIETLSDDEA